MTKKEWEVAEHEAGHASAALVQGLPVTRVSRRSADPQRYLGYTSIPITDIVEDIDKRKAREVAIMLLAGPAMSSQPLPTWPLSDNNTSDEKLLNSFCKYLGMTTETDYLGLQAEMWRLSVTKRFDRLFTVLMMWFEHVHTLDEDILTWCKAKVLTW